MPRLRSACLPLLATSALALSACGGGSGGDPTADPAAIVPPGSPVYIEANLKPGDDIKDLATKLSGEEDPGAAFKRWFEREVADETPGFKFSEDVDPWLGERAGIFVPRVSAGGDNAVGAIFATKDADKAEEALENTLKEGDKGEKPRVETRKHKDMEYFVDTTDGDATAIVEEYAVAGNEAAIKTVIDQASGDADALADTSEYKKARDSVEADGLAFVYVRLSQVFSGLGPQGAAARQVFGGLGETLAIGFDGDGSKAEVETAALGVSGEGTGGPGEMLPQLPSSAWFAAGAADVGGQLDKLLDQFTQLGALGGTDPEQILDQIEAQIGLDPRRDLASWMGDIGLYAFGDTLAEAGGGLIVAVKEPAAARRALPRIARLLATEAGLRARPLRRSGVDLGVTLTSSEIPVPLHLVLTDDDRFIVALTNPGLSQALQKTDPLGESDAYTDAAQLLGEDIKPQVFMNFAPLAGFAEGAGAGSDPNGQKVIDALGKLTVMGAGTKREGDVGRGRIVVGVK